jgi:signal transduction histidine kinase
MVDLERIRSSQENLLTLISELLTFVQTEGGRLEYRFSAVPVQVILDEVADTVRGAVDEGRFALVHWPSDGDAMIWVDPDRARQILLNLVMNAVKYATGAGGQITLSLATTPQDVSIHVADTGPGIPGEKLVAIFEPFVQLANGLTERRGGVGLGLTISRDLARAMKGDLTVESTVGIGSRFTLRLPRASGFVSS